MSKTNAYGEFSGRNKRTTSMPKKQEDVSESLNNCSSSPYFIRLVMLCGKIPAL